jgi:hypothetical protein
MKPPVEIQRSRKTHQPMKKTTLTAGELATTGPITPANGVDLLMGLSHTRPDTRRTGENADGGRHRRLIKTELFLFRTTPAIYC